MSEHEHDSAIWPPVEPIRAGLAGRCPRCGEGRLFSGFLTVAESCGVCGLDYSFADAGDGPAIITDTDPQGTAGDWFNQRRKAGLETPRYAPLALDNLAGKLQALDDAGAAYLLNP